MSRDSSLQESPSSDSTRADPQLRVVLLPSLFLMVAMFNLTLIVAGLEELIVDDLGGTRHDASLFFAIEMLAYILFAPVWGVVSDRLGRRKPLVIIGFLASAPLYWAFSETTSIQVLLGLRFLQGACSVMAWSTLMAMVLDQPDEKRRGRFMGLMGGALIFGISMGAPVGGYVTRHLGARAPLQVAAVLFLLVGLGSFYISSPARLRTRVSVRSTMSILTERPRLLLPYAFYFVDRFTIGHFVVLFPLYLSSLGVDDPALRGHYLGVFLLPFAFLQYFSGRLVDRVGPWKPLLAGSFAFGLGLAAVGVSDLHQLWWVMAVLGVMASVMFPPTLTLTALWSGPDHRATAMGGFNLAGSLGFAIGPLAGSWIWSHFGYGYAFAVSGGLEIVVATSATMLYLRWRRTLDLKAIAG